MGLGDTLMKARISRRLPQADVDGGREGEPVRGNRYGEQLIALAVPTLHSLSDEGSFWTTSNPVPGTALAAPVAAAFADTSALYQILNTADPNDANAKSIYLAHLKQMFTVVPASATGMRYLIRKDKGPRTPSAGFSVLAGLGGLPGAIAPGPIVGGSIAKVWGFTGGAQITVPAVTSDGRTVALGGVPGIPIIGGEYEVLFGLGDSAGSSLASRANPVVIEPGWVATIHVWFPGNAATGASIEPELSWWER